CRQEGPPPSSGAPWPHHLLLLRSALDHKRCTGPRWSARQTRSNSGRGAAGKPEGRRNRASLISFTNSYGEQMQRVRRRVVKSEPVRYLLPATSGEVLTFTI